MTAAENELVYNLKVAASGEGEHDHGRLHTAAAALIESQAARIEAVLALHSENPYATECMECGDQFTFPCPTRRALTEDTP